MNVKMTHAERVRRWFAAGARPEPPTDEELMALAAGRFDVIDAEAVAEALACDPGSQRRYEEVQEFLERRTQLPAEEPAGATEGVPASRSLVEQARAWLSAKGCVLAATVRRAGQALGDVVEGSWSLDALGAPATLAMQGFASPGPAMVRLEDEAGRRVVIATGPTGYLIEFDLKDPRLVGMLMVQRVALYGSGELPFERRVLLRGGRGTLTDCPPGLLHAQMGTGFEMYLLLEDVPTDPGAGTDGARERA